MAARRAMVIIQHRNGFFRDGKAVKGGFLPVKGFIEKLC
jgi:hypothetical protein